MPLGLSNPRRLTGTTPPSIVPRWLIAVALAMTSIGCNAVPSITRLSARSPEVKTKSSLDPPRPATEAPVVASSPAPALSPAPARLELDRLDEESPLPPALERTPGAIVLPPSREPIPPAAAPAATPEPTPILDEAIVRANAQTEAIADEVARAAEPKPAPAAVVVATTAPKPVPEPKPDSSPPSAPAVEPRRPEEVWREGIQALRAVARERMTTATTPNSPNWAVRDRLLVWLAEPDIDPDPRSNEAAAQGRLVLKGLATLLDPAGSTASSGPAIRDAVAALESKAPLELAELKLCRKVEGFGNIDPFEPATRKPGQAVIVYCEVAGLAYEPIGPAFRSRLAAKIEILAEGSETPVWSQSPEVAEDTCRRRRRDFYVNYRINLPESIAPGSYRLRLTQRDLVADRVATRDTGLTIQK